MVHVVVVFESYFGDDTIIYVNVEAFVLWSLFYVDDEVIRLIIQEVVVR